MEKTTPQKESKPTAMTEQFHFSGGGEYEPITIEATSLEEATEMWKEQALPITK